MVNCKCICSGRPFCVHFIICYFIISHQMRKKDYIKGNTLHKNAFLCFLLLLSELN